MNKLTPSSNRGSKKEILAAIKRNDGPYRMHGDPELRTVPEPTRSKRAERAERAEASLLRLDKAGVSSQDRRRRGLGVVSGALAAGILAVTPVGEGIGTILQDTGERIDANFDADNLPPGRQPVEFRGGVAYEPGTDNTIVLPPVVIEP